MSLIEETKKLRELEQKATPVKWILSNPLKGEYQIYSEFGDLNIEFEDSDIDDPRYIVVSRNLAPAMLAPAMLEVLGCFREGDAKLLDRLVYEETDMAKFRAGFGKISDREQDMIDMLKRLQKAASPMEQEREKDDLGYTRI